MSIKSFSGKHRFLSNFWPCKVIFEGVEYPSTENAYQAAKTLDLEKRKEFLTCTSAQAKKLSRKIPLREDWEAVKLSVMEDLLRQKFSPGSPLLAQLEATGDAEITEGNYWHDLWWGTCTCGKHNGEGRNELGKLLIRIREGK